MLKIEDERILQEKISPYICTLFDPMKKIFLLLLSLSFLSATAQVVSSDIAPKQKELFRKNKIRSISGWTFSYAEGKIDKNGQRTSFEKLDKDGNQCEEVYYNATGESYLECTHVYNAGNEVSTVRYADGTPNLNKWVYEKGEKPGSIEKRSSSKLAGKEKWVFVYDDFSNLISEEYYDASGTNTYKKTYVYKYPGTLIEKNEYDAYGSLYARTEYRYDASGNLKEKVQFDGANAISAHYEFVYDRSGNQIARFTHDNAGNVKELTVYLYYYYQ